MENAIPLKTRCIASAGAAVAAIAVVKLVLHLYAGRHYGYFVDELYYLACSEHLAWGYVDQPPLIAVITRIGRVLFGDSLAAIHLLPALAGTAKVVLAAVIARELGGRRFAQALAAFAVLVAPGYLALDNLLTMNVFEPLFWMGCAYVLIRIVKTGNERLWLWFGLLAGLGLENKHSMLIFGAGIVAGLLVTPARRSFRSPWIWVAGALAFLIFLPNLLWNFQHHFPFLELQENIRRSGRNVAMPPLAFLTGLTSFMLPLTLPVWLAGLWYFFFAREGKPYRALGWAFLFTLGVIMAMNPRIYYAGPAFPMLFGAGAVAWESWLARPRLEWVKSAYFAVTAICAAAIAPLYLPVLPPATYIRYSHAIGMEQARVENHKLGPLPQLYADQFGWEEMVATTAKFYRTLPPEVRAKTAIFGSNFGQAGAVDLFGPKYGLPKAISGHQNYYFWGPRGYTGESVIVLGETRDQLKACSTVEQVGRADHPYAMPYEHFDIFYCRGLNPPLDKLWPSVKNWN
jgi:4-amino-4-deoxy-L-arabinose transferase-like glycosyltransferase